MNKYLSEKIKLISLISMILVVFLHSYHEIVKFNSTTSNFDSKLSLFIQEFISHGIANIAVPIFFCISGYLFFLKFTGRKEEFVMKYQRRIRSLLLPYLFWSVWGLLIYFTLQQIPFSKIFFTKDLIETYSFFMILDTIFINPIPYQLWFVRDLIVLVFISPLIYWIIKYLRAIPIILLLAAWSDLLNFNFVIFESVSIFFFSLGGYFAIYRSNLILKKLDQKYYYVFVFLWILLVSSKIFLQFQNPDQTILIALLNKVSILVGMIGLWSVYDIIMWKKTTPNKNLLYFSTFSFFIYTSHEPILTMIKKGLFYIAGMSEITSILIYFSAPIITITLVVILAIFLKQSFPKLYEFVSGRR